tara:strand:+ start:7326 stop:7544 length:219 start_codon:yes stop_codon:yes gene_type:complete
MLKVVPSGTASAAPLHLTQREKKAVKDLTDCDRARFSSQDEFDNFKVASLERFSGGTAEEKLMQHLIDINLK